jgi:long-subunit acyl-CoA synthetase (AMP-forming)
LNRPEWVITDLACHAYSLTTVALYDTLGTDASEFILNQTQSPIVVASIDHVPHLIQLKHKLPSLKLVISMDDLNEGDLKGRSKGDLLDVWAQENGLHLISFRDGKAHLRTSLNSQLRHSVRPLRDSPFRRLPVRLLPSITPLGQQACQRAQY